MGESLILRRELKLNKLPILNNKYPADIAVTASANGKATFHIQIATAGKPAEYVYQWYVDGSAVSGATNDTYTKTGLTSAKSYTVYCTITNEAGTVESRHATLTVKSYVPAQNDTFTYVDDNGASISCDVIDDKNYNWRIKFKKSGIFTPSQNMNIDIFLVGGGGSGCAGSGGGGGGGYTKTYTGYALKAGEEYAIHIGAGGAKVSSNDGGYNTGASGKTGGTTSAFGYTATGGQGGQKADSTYSYGYGGKGGSGGGAGRAAGGSNGNDGSDNKSTTAGPGKGGKGQGSTTREFGEDSGTLYAGGGGGGSVPDSGTYTSYAGGSGGGGATCKSGVANSGGGGGGGLYRPSENGYKAGAGGSGIVVIRNAR